MVIVFEWCQRTLLSAKILVRFSLHAPQTTETTHTHAQKENNNNGKERNKKCRSWIT